MQHTHRGRQLPQHSQPTGLLSGSKRVQSEVNSVWFEGERGTAHTILHASRKGMEPQSSQQSRERKCIKKEFSSNQERNFTAERLRQQYNRRGVWIRYQEEKEEGIATPTARTPTDAPICRTLVRAEEEDFISISNPNNWLHEQPKVTPGWFWILVKSSALLHRGTLGHSSPPHHIQTSGTYVPADMDCVFGTAQTWRNISLRPERQPLRLATQPGDTA